MLKSLRCLLEPAHLQVPVFFDPVLLDLDGKSLDQPEKQSCVPPWVTRRLWRHRRATPRDRRPTRLCARFHWER